MELRRRGHTRLHLSILLWLLAVRYLIVGTYMFVSLLFSLLCYFYMKSLVLKVVQLINSIKQLMIKS